MFKKLWKLILVILIIIIAIYFPAILAFIGEALAAAFPMMAPTIAAILPGLAAIPWWVGAAAGVGLAYLVDPSTTKEIIGDAGEVVGEVGKAVGGVVGDTAGALVKKLAPVLIAAGAAWLIFFRKKKDEPQQIEVTTPEPLPPTESVKDAEATNANV